MKPRILFATILTLCLWLGHPALSQTNLPVGNLPVRLSIGPSDSILGAANGTNPVRFPSSIFGGTNTFPIIGNTWDIGPNGLYGTFLGSGVFNETNLIHIGYHLSGGIATPEYYFSSVDGHAYFSGGAITVDSHGNVAAASFAGSAVSLTNLPISAMQTNGFAPLQVLGLKADGSGFGPLTQSGGGGVTGITGSGNAVVTTNGSGVVNINVTGSGGPEMIIHTPSGAAPMLLHTYIGLQISGVDGVTASSGGGGGVAGVTGSGGATVTTNGSGVVNINVTEAGGDVLQSGQNNFSGSNYLAGNTTFLLPIVGSANGQTNANGYRVAGLNDATNAATTAAQNATNPLGSAAWKATSYFDLANSALNATQGLGSAAWTAASAYDASGAAHNATNPLGSAAFTAASAYDAAGSAATAAQNATNGLGSAAFKATGFFDLAGVGATASLLATQGVALWNTWINSSGGKGTNNTFITPSLTGASLANPTVSSLNSPVSSMNLIGEDISGNLTAAGAYVNNVSGDMALGGGAYFLGLFAGDGSSLSNISWPAITNLQSAQLPLSVITNFSVTNLVGTVIYPGATMATIQSAFTAGGVIQFYPNTTYTLTTNIQITAAVTIYLNGSTLSYASGLTNFMLDGALNTLGGQFILQGPGIIDGGRYQGYSSPSFYVDIGGGASFDLYYNPNWTNHSGLRVNSSNGGYIQGVTFRGWAGQAVMLDNPYCNYAYQHPRISIYQDTFYSNFCGVHICGNASMYPGYYGSSAGLWANAQAEYTTVQNTISTYEYVAVFCSPGNGSFQNNNIDNCLFGFLSCSSPNSAHGIIENNTVNHTDYCVYCENNEGYKIMGNNFLGGGLYDTNDTLVANAMNTAVGQWMTIQNNNFSSVNICLTNGCTGIFKDNYFVNGFWGGSGIYTNFTGYSGLIAGNQIATNQTDSSFSSAIELGGIVAGANITVVNNLTNVSIASSGGGSQIPVCGSLYFSNTTTVAAHNTGAIGAQGSYLNGIGPIASVVTGGAHGAGVSNFWFEVLATTGISQSTNIAAIVCTNEVATSMLATNICVTTGGLSVTNDLSAAHGFTVTNGSRMEITIVPSAALASPLCLAWGFTLYPY